MPKRKCWRVYRVSNKRWLRQRGQLTTKVFIERTRIAAGGALYCVTREDGSVLIGATPNAEYDACRALLAKGVTGQLEVWRKGTTFPAMRLDIEKAAKLTVSEGVKSGPTIRPWRPFSGSPGSDGRTQPVVSIPVDAGKHGQPSRTGPLPT